MLNIRKCLGAFRRLASDEAGTTATVFAVASFVTLSMIGGAVDINRLSSAKANLQDVADGMALAAANHKRNDGLIASDVAELVLTEKGISSKINLNEPEIVVDDVTKTVNVKLRAQPDLIFAGLLPDSIGNVSAESMATWSAAVGTPISIGFVLDISGSMNGYTTDGVIRKDALRDSVIALFNGLAEQGFNSTNYRTGGWFYSWSIRSSYTVSLQAGDSLMRQRVQSISAYGSTNPSSSMETGVDALIEQSDKDSRENTLVYMSDGEIDDHLSWGSLNYTQRTLAACETAKANNVRVVSIWLVAEEQDSDTMLACASTDEDYAEISTADCLDDIEACRLIKTENYFEAQTATELAAAFENAGPLQGEDNARLQY